MRIFIASGFLASLSSQPSSPLVSFYPELVKQFFEYGKVIPATDQACLQQAFKLVRSEDID
jgi:hypothetical protein